MEYIYKPKGVCSVQMKFDIDNNIIKGLEVIGGCNGNLKGISSLITGMDIDSVILKLKGIKCGIKNTSCPDQIAEALKEYKSKNNI